MKRLAALLFTLLLLASPFVAHAQEQESAPEQAMSHAVNEAVDEELINHQEEGHKGGLPQFNVATWPSQVFWLLVTFLFLYVFYAKAILPSLSGTIQKRTDKIQGDILTAEAMSAKAEEIRMGYEAELKKASGKVSSDTKSIEEEAKAKLAQSLADFRKRYEAETSAVETRLEQSKEAALGDMRNWPRKLQRKLQKKSQVFQLIAHKRKT